MKKANFYLKLLKSLRKSNLEPQELEKLPELIETLGAAFSVEKALGLARQAAQRAQHASMDESEKQVIYKKIEEKLKENILKNFDNLRYIGLYSKPHQINGEKNYIFNHREKINNCLNGFNSITQIVNSATSHRVYCSEIHPTLEIDFKYSGDYIFATVDFPPKREKLDIYLEKDFLETDKDGVHHFKQSYTVELSLSGFFAKDISLLQMCAYFGLEQLVEALVVDGCDINYREKVTGKKAFDFYRTGFNSTPEQQAYTRSLLDGSYEQGKYVALYEKKKLEKTISTPNNTGAKDQLNKL